MNGHTTNRIVRAALALEAAEALAEQASAAIIDAEDEAKFARAELREAEEEAEEEARIATSSVQDALRGLLAAHGVEDVRLAGQISAELAQTLTSVVAAQDLSPLGTGGWSDASLTLAGALAGVRRKASRRWGAWSSGGKRFT